MAACTALYATPKTAILGAILLTGYLGGAAATQWQGPFGAVTHTIAVRPGGWFGIACVDATAWPAAAGTDFLRIANSGAGTDVTYTIILLGSSA